MPAEPPSLMSLTRDAGTLLLRLGGDWDIRHNPPDFMAVEPELNGPTPATRVTFDTAALASYDSSLISLLLQIHHRCEAAGSVFDSSSLPEAMNQLLDMALAVPEKQDARSAESQRAFFYRIGAASIHVVDEFFDMLTFLGDCLLSFGRLVVGRARFRRRDLSLTLQECGVEALPIVCLIGGLIGMIFAFVGAFQMATYGAVTYVADLVAVAMVREMGCLMTGIIMSGRTGAAFAAQLGSMKVNEEIDALRTFGFSPVDFLVLPRMLALILMMPLLTIYAIVIGIAGGALVTCLGYDVSFESYFSQTVNALNLQSCAIGIGKSVVFGVIVAGAGCLRGMQSGSSASAVGTAATSAVVVSITAIILADCVFAVISTVFHI